MIRLLRPHKEKVTQGRNQDFLEMRLTRDGSSGWCEWCSLSSSEFYEFIFRSCRICMINDHFFIWSLVPTLLESIITRHFEMGIVTKRAYFLYFPLVSEFLKCRWFTTRKFRPVNQSLFFFSNMFKYIQNRINNFIHQNKDYPSCSTALGCFVFPRSWSRVMLAHERLK